MSKNKKAVKKSNPNGWKFGGGQEPRFPPAGSWADGAAPGAWPRRGMIRAEAGVGGAPGAADQTGLRAMACASEPSAYTPAAARAALPGASCAALRESG